MKFLVYFIPVILCVENLQKEDLFPFTSVKIDTEDNIYATLDHKRDKWNRVLSVDNLGSDAIVNFCKEHYGLNNCDYEIECYKYHIVANFDKVYTQMTGKKFKNSIPVELEYDNKRQNGMDILCSSDNFNIYQKNIPANMKLSNTRQSGKNFLTKGINKLKRSFSMIFEDNSRNEGKILLNKLEDLDKEINQIVNQEKNVKVRIKHDLT